MNVVIVKHAAGEGPGVFKDILIEKGLSFMLADGTEGVFPPAGSGDFRAVVLMGGPQTVYETDKHPYLAKEGAWVASLHEKGVPLLGVCLGAQIIAQALGAQVRRNREKEIGWFPVRLPRQAKADPLCKLLPDVFTTFHWHGDTFDLPVGAVHLAQSDRTRNQAFRAGDSTWGLQFHPEVGPKDIAAWLKEDDPEVGPKLRAEIDKGTAQHGQGNPGLGRKVFEGFLAQAGF